MSTDSLIRSEVKTFLIELTNAYRTGDYEKLRSMHADDPDIYWVGTESVHVGPESVAAILREICHEEDDTEMKIDLSFRTNIIVRDPLVCVGTELNVYTKEDGRSVQRRGRFTATLERYGHTWRVLQQHLSLPAAWKRDI